MASNRYLTEEELMDYKQMYMKMVKASEEAMEILIRAQRECEELDLEQTDGEDAPDEPCKP